MTTSELFRAILKSGMAMNGVRRSLNGVRCSVFCSDFLLFGERLFGVRRSAFGVQGVRCSAFCSALFLACCFVRCSVRKGLCAWSFVRCSAFEKDLFCSCSAFGERRWQRRFLFMNGCCVQRAVRSERLFVFGQRCSVPCLCNPESGLQRSK